MVLPVFSSNETFSSLPVISSWARTPPARSNVPTPGTSAASRNVALMVPFPILAATLPRPHLPRQAERFLDPQRSFRR